MFELAGPIPAANSERAEELFQQHRRRIFRDTDKLFARLMLFQWVACIVIALVVSPRTWDGEASQIHIHVWSALLIGGAISLFPVWMTRVWPGSVATRNVIAVAQMLMSALLIALTGGRIETHFHVFGSLVVLSFYRDWRVLVPATVVVGLDHFLRGVYLPYSVYGVLSASPWRSLEHAGWVVFENVFLVISCFRSIREMRFIANRTASLEASDQRSRQLFDDAPIGMAVVALDNEKFRQVNARFTEMIGYSEVELLERTPLNLTHPDDLAESQRLVKALLDGRERCSLEKRYIRKNGELLWVNRTACVICDKDSNPREFLIMVEDITERKLVEEALREAKKEADRANHAKSEFLSRMSHELRTPLNAILGFNEMILGQVYGEVPVGMQEPLADIQTSGKHLLRLINNVLDLAKIEAGRMELFLQDYSVHDVVESVRSTLRPLAAEKGLEFVAVLPGDLPLAYGDSGRITQCLMNLAGNSLKFTKTGKVEIAVATKGDLLVYKVADTGIGIPPDKLETVFAEFRQTDATIASEYGGTGLGLSISRKFVEMHGGRIWVESELGKGSTFIFEIPLRAATAAAA